MELLIFNNEEELKSKLLQPYLISLGFDYSEISLEKSFTIRLGKNENIISTNEKHGRLDLLCHKYGKNLFIIELKRDSIPITQDDVDQGISYSRLLDNIAPFTIISNGKETRIYDTISKKEISGKNIAEESDFWRNECTLSTEDDLKVRHLALKNFVSFSEANLKIFCEKQVKSRMDTIIGQPNDVNSKFSKELYLKRNELHKVFNDFIESNAHIFSIVGMAGVGKTNSICALALDSLENHFTLFYNAALINKSPLYYIAQDLNLFFSDNKDQNKTLKQLNDLGEFAGKKIIIFIDAIDEAGDQKFSYEISEISHAVKNFINIKICISCKLSIWDKFLFINDSKSHLYNELFWHEEINSSNSGPTNKPGYLLEEFDDKELNKLLPVYQNKFCLKGTISDTLRGDIKNGFFLRVFSEVYRDREIPQSINDLQLIEKYISLSLTKLNIEKSIALRILSKIGEVLVSADYSDMNPFRYEGIRIDTILEKLKMPINESIPESLFSRNILIKTDDDDSVKVSFYYSKIRDYIICYHSYKLDELNDEEFENTLELFFENSIGQSAIYFYSINAKYSHLSVLSKYKEYKIVSYVEAYNSFLNKHFKNFKELFDPYTKGDIGIVVPENLTSSIGGYALFPLNSSSQERIVKDKNAMDILSDTSMKIYDQYGANTMHGSYESLLSKNADELVRKNLFNQLKKIVDKGGLNESECDIILIEKVVNIFYFYHKILGYTFETEDYYYPRYSKIYPIDLEDISEKIYKFYAAHHFKEMHIKGLIESGEILVKNNAYSPRLNKNDWDIINERIQYVIKNKVSIPEPKVTGDFPPFVALKKMVNQLQQKGYNSIYQHYLPNPDKPVYEVNSVINKRKGRKSWIPDILSAQFSDKHAENYIKEFLKKLEVTYKEVVEYCFPTLKNQFSFYSTLPHKYIVYMKEFENFNMYGFGCGPSKNHEIEVHFVNRFFSDIDFKKEGIETLRSSNFSNFLRNTNTLKTVSKINTSKVDEYCILRNWLYDFIKSDIKKMIQEKNINADF